MSILLWVFLLIEYIDPGTNAHFWNVTQDYHYGQFINSSQSFYFPDSYLCTSMPDTADLLLVVNTRFMPPEYQDGDWVDMLREVTDSVFHKTRVAVGYVGGIHNSSSSFTCSDVTLDFTEDWTTISAALSDLYKYQTQIDPNQDLYGYDFLFNAWQIAWSDPRLHWNETSDIRVDPTYYRGILVFSGGSAPWSSYADNAYSPDLTSMVQEPVFHRPVMCGETPLDLNQLRLSATELGHQAQFSIVNLDFLPRSVCTDNFTFCAADEANYLLHYRFWDFLPGDYVFTSVARGNVAKQKQAVYWTLKHSYCSVLAKNAILYHHQQDIPENEMGSIVPDSGNRPSKDDDGGRFYPFPSNEPEDSFPWWIIFVVTAVILGAGLGLMWWYHGKICHPDCSKLGMEFKRDLRWWRKDPGIEEEFDPLGNNEGDYDLSSDVHISLSSNKVQNVESRTAVEGFLD